MESFLPLQKEFEHISHTLRPLAPLDAASARQPDFLQVIDRSDYLITIHDVEYYRPICINERLRAFYGFKNRVLQGMDHFYYLKTMHLSTYYTLIESMAFFRNDQSGYLDLTYKLRDATHQWKVAIGTSKAIMRDDRGRPKIAMTVMDVAQRDLSPSPHERYLLLTPREREIVDLLCTGLSKKEIADRLFISPATVVTHVKNIYRKLGINKVSELAMLMDRFDR